MPFADSWQKKLDRRGKTPLEYAKLYGDPFILNAVDPSHKVPAEFLAPVSKFAPGCRVDGADGGGADGAGGAADGSGGQKAEAPKSGGASGANYAANKRGSSMSPVLIDFHLM